MTYSFSSCQEAYNNARETFEGVIYAFTFASMFLSIILLPKSSLEGRRDSCCISCPHGMTFCLRSCRPLLSKEERQVANAAQSLGTTVSVTYVVLFIILQAVPVAGLLVGLLAFYPSCPCSEDAAFANACKCILKVNGIPVGSCTGSAIVFVSFFCMCGLRFMKLATRNLRVIQTAASYSLSPAPQPALHGGDQEMV